MTPPFLLALHGMAHGFIELDKAVIHVWLVLVNQTMISLVSFLWLWFSSVCPLMAKDKRLVEASCWERLTLYVDSQLFCLYGHAKSLHSFPTLCNSMDCSPPSSCVHGILQARISPSSKGSSRPRDRTCISSSSYIAGRFFTTEPPGKPIFWQAPLSMGIPRQEYWSALPFFQVSSQTTDQTHVFCINRQIFFFFFTHWATREVFCLKYAYIFCFSFL